MPKKYYVLRAFPEGVVEILHSKTELPNFTSKCIVLDMNDDESIAFVIGWDISKEDYLHSFICDAVSKHFKRSVSPMGGAKIIYNEGKYKLQGKSVDFGPIGAPLASYFSSFLGFELEYPYGLPLAEWS